MSINKKKHVVMYPCENIKYMHCNDANCSNPGMCLIVPVSVHNVCKNECLLVIVEVYKDNCLYARQVKKVFTGSKQKHECGYNNFNCSCSDNLIDCLFIDNFEFYFLNECDPMCICVEVKTQYIYS